VCVCPVKSKAEVVCVLSEGTSSAKAIFTPEQQIYTSVCQRKARKSYGPTWCAHTHTHTHTHLPLCCAVCLVFREQSLILMHTCIFRQRLPPCTHPSALIVKEPWRQHTHTHTHTHTHSTINLAVLERLVAEKQIHCVKCKDKKQGYKVKWYSSSPTNWKWCHRLLTPTSFQTS